MWGIAITLLPLWSISTLILSPRQPCFLSPEMDCSFLEFDVSGIMLSVFLNFICVTVSVSSSFLPPNGVLFYESTALFLCNGLCIHKLRILYTIFDKDINDEYCFLNSYVNLNIFLANSLNFVCFVSYFVPFMSLSLEPWLLARCLPKCHGGTSSYKSCHNG